MLGNDFNVMWVKQTPGYTMASPHIHPFYEVYYVLAGTGRFVLDGHTYDVTPNTLLIISPFVSHINMLRSPDYERIIVELPQKTLQHLLRSLGLPDTADMINNKWIIINDEPDHTKHRQNLLMQVHKEYTTKPLYHDARIKLLMCDLIIDVCKNAKTSGICMGEGAVVKNETVVKVASFLSAHYSEHISLDNIANLFHMEKTYLCKVFKKTLGVTIWDYLTLLRVQRACSLLIDTNQKIIEIAHSTGFGSAAHFERTLKKFTGCSPTAFRKQLLVVNSHLS